MLYKIFLAIVFVVMVNADPVIEENMLSIDAIDAAMQNVIKVMQNKLAYEWPPLSRAEGEKIIEHTKQVLADCKTELPDTPNQRKLYRRCCEKALDNGWHELRILFSKYYRPYSSGASRMTSFLWG